jgi:HAD superfamily hydrolase (TIGR01509 family)
MYQAVIFDCFGVIYTDAYGSFYKKHRDLFKDHPTIFNELNDKIDLGKITQPELFSQLGKAIGIEPKLIQSEIDQYLEINKPLVELISTLRGKYKIGLISNAGEDEIEVVYRDHVDSLLDAIIISSTHGITKPDPDIFRICLRELGVKALECIFVDDYRRFGTIPQFLVDLIGNEPF